MSSEPNRSTTKKKSSITTLLPGWSFRLIVAGALLLSALLLLRTLSADPSASDSGYLPDYGNLEAAELEQNSTPRERPDYDAYADLLVPPLPPEQALETFQLEEGFRIELVAHEPDIIDPVAMDIDSDGRLWVVEMQSYMPVHDRSDHETSVRERVPQGRVIVLEDTNHDGRMDSSRVFMDELILPRAIKVLDDGVLIAEPPTVWFIQDTTGDGIGDTKQMITNRYGDPTTNNVEDMPNGLMWGVDNWLYSSGSGVDNIRRINGEWLSRPFERLGQWGITHDNMGGLYSGHNSRTLPTHLVPHGYSHRHPDFDRSSGLYHNISESETVWPAHVTGVNRGYRVGTIVREDGTLKRTTAISGPVIYRGGQFGEEYLGNAFVPEPAGNLIKRLTLDNNPDSIDAVARFAYREQEFLTSVDERFRPVNLYNSPDGSIYIVDMYKGLFQHARFLTDHLRDYAVEHGLHKPSGPGQFGRIYRIVREDREIDYSGPKLRRANPDQLVDYLTHENGLVRDHAQQLLVQRSPSGVAEKLVGLVDDPDQKAPTRLQALWTLEGLDRKEFSREQLTDLAITTLSDPHPRIRSSAIRLLEPEITSRNVLNHLLEMVESETAPSVQLQLLATLGESTSEETLQAMAQLLDGNADSPYFLEMAITGVYLREQLFLDLLTTQFHWDPDQGENQAEFLEFLMEAANRQTGLVASADNKLGRQLYVTCSACHGNNGQGIPGAAPSLAGSSWVKGEPDALIRILLNGFRDGDHGEPIAGVMPAHSFLSDEEAAAVLTYIRRSWNNDASVVTPEDVGHIRKQSGNRLEEWTPDELKKVIE